MKAVLFLGLGALLLLVGLSSLPRLLGRIGEEDEAKVIGRALVVGFEVLLGLGLVVIGIRSTRRGT
jgi:hypothetical protein